MTTEYTENFRLNLPDFRMGPWHDLINTNTVNIDELLLNILNNNGTVIWTNSTLFEAGVTALDEVNNSYWACCVTHTSAAIPTTFAADRAAHPTYWTRVAVGINPRGIWAQNVHYLVNDLVTDTTEGVIALCITEHTSSAFSATIRTDAIYWAFIADMGPVGVGPMGPPGPPGPSGPVGPTGATGATGSGCHGLQGQRELQGQQVQRARRVQ